MPRKILQVAVMLSGLTVLALLPNRYRWTHLVPYLTVVVVSMVISASQSILRSYRLRVGDSWGAAMGTVESKEVKADQHQGGLLSPYELQIAYSYRAGGDWYSGFDSRRFDRESEAEKGGLALRGQSVFVRYNPQHPEESVVDWMAPAGNIQAYLNPAERI
jgi:hypothetical protein